MRKHVLNYIIIFALYSILLFVLFRLPVFSFQDVLFFRGLYILVTLSTCFFIGIAVASKKSKIDVQDLVSATIISAAIHITFFVLFPVTFDRSVTIYYLNRLNNTPPTQQCKGLTLEESQKAFVDEYVYEAGAIEKRIKEQSVTGFVSGDNSCITITQKGKSFIVFSEIVEMLYSLK